MKPVAMRREELVRDLDVLLQEICVLHGFCNKLSASRLLTGTGQSIRAEEFARFVLEAEAMEDDLEARWRGILMRLFTERYAGQSISAQAYAARQKASLGA